MFRKIIMYTPHRNFLSEINTLEQSYQNAIKSIELNLKRINSNVELARKECVCEEEEPCYCFDELEQEEYHIWRAFEEECKSIIDRLVAQFIMSLRRFTSQRSVSRRSSESEIGALIRFIETSMGIDICTQQDSISFIDNNLRSIRVQNQHNPVGYSKDQLDELHKVISKGFQICKDFLEFLCDQKYSNTQR